MGRVIEPRKRHESEESTWSPGREDLGASPDAAAEKSSEAGADLPGSESSARHHMFPARKPGDLEGASSSKQGDRQAREGDEPQAVETQVSKPDAFEESGAPIVPEKSANSRVTPEESMEGRGAAEGKLAQRNALRTQRRQGRASWSEWAEGMREEAEQLNSLILRQALLPLTQGGSPVREIRTPGSVRGAARKGRPYRAV